jgi:hypothetical protein
VQEGLQGGEDSWGKLGKQEMGEDSEVSPPIFTPLAKRGRDGQSSLTVFVIPRESGVFGKSEPS